MLVINKKIFLILRILTALLVILSLVVIIGDVSIADTVYFPKRSILLVTYLFAIIFAEKHKLILWLLLGISVAGLILYFTPNTKASIPWYVYTSGFRDFIEFGSKNVTKVALYSIPLVIHVLMTVSIILKIIYDRKSTPA